MINLDLIIIHGKTIVKLEEMGYDKVDMDKKNKKQSVCVVGLGYVGLPLAVQCARKGYAVFGLDNDKSKIDKINSGISPIKEVFLEENLPKINITATTDANIIKKADIVIVCVPTPVDEKFYPDLKPVETAVVSIIQNMPRGVLVIIESTINPGVCEEFIEPIFKKAGYEIGRDYEMAHCPERINPGDSKWNVTNIPRVVGSFTEKGLAAAKEFYESIIDAPVYPMKSIREAEAVKIVENSFRDINIAFVNELARSFDKLGIDVVDVIKGASTKPFSFMPHWPSCGVGGHCIPVDPYYLIERAKLSGFDHRLLRIAREINNSMPAYTVELLQDALNEMKLPMNGTDIGVLGVSYKADVADLRESPSLKIINFLKKHGVAVHVFDPHVAEFNTEKKLKDVLEKCEAVVVATDHKEFRELNPEVFKNNGIRLIIDGKNCLNKTDIEKLGISYKGIGR